MSRSPKMSDISNVTERELATLEKEILQFAFKPLEVIEEKAEELALRTMEKNHLHRVDADELFSYLRTTAVLGV